MNTSKITSVAFKAFCNVLCGFLLTGALGFVVQKNYSEVAIGGVGFISAIPLAIRKASFKNFVYTILITIATMYLVGIVEC